MRVRNTRGFDMEVVQEGNDVVVIADQERGLFGFGGGSNIRFDVSVPMDYNVDLNTGGGSITVADINGEVRADTSGAGSLSVGSMAVMSW